MLSALTSVRRKFRSIDHTIYFHSPCFDGIIACVLAWDFLGEELGWSIRRIQPVNYEQKATWLNSAVNERCAVLDFLYHPSAGFWVDHHATTFLNPVAEANYRARASGERSTLLYDSHYGSTASLLWDSFKSFFSSRPRFSDMAKWADKIDSARYESVKEAIFGDAPALQINFSLMLADAMYCEFLVRHLRERDLKQVSELPEVAQRFEEVRKRIDKGLEHLRNRIMLLEDGIVAFDVDTAEDAIVSRYAPYYFHPDARYSIGLSRRSEGVGITAMRNPWLEFESVPLGEVFKRHGGGGHRRVASVFLSGDRAKSAEKIADEILSEMRNEQDRPALREAIVA